MSLKSLFKIFAVFTIAILIGCKKDAAVKIPSDTTPPPFVEYRDHFVGSYLGSFTSYTKVSIYYSYLPYEPNYIPQNYLVTVHKSGSSDSTLVLKCFGKVSFPFLSSMNSVPSATYTFKILANGKYLYNYFRDRQGLNYSITLRNDSLYVNREEILGTYLSTTYNIFIYNGVKQ